MRMQWRLIIVECWCGRLTVHVWNGCCYITVDPETHTRQNGICFLSLEKPILHCKKRLSIFPTPAGMSLTKLSLDGKNLLILGQVDFS